MKTRNCCLHHNRILSIEYFCRFVWWRFLFTYEKYFIVFLWRFTIISTTHNDVINMKPNWGCCVWIIIIYFFLINIYTEKFRTAQYYTFPVWQCIIRLSICTHFILFCIICFGVKMTSMWHHCIFICFKYAIWFSTRTSGLNIETLIFNFSNAYHTRIAMISVYF